MTAFFCDERAMAQRLARWPQLAIAAVNASDEVVVSGDAAAIDELRRACAADGVESRPLRVSHAFHSAWLDPVLDEFERTAMQLAYAAPRVPILSNLTGRELKPGDLNASYWRRHARQTVRFADAMRAIPDRPSVFLEVGPGTTLTALGRRSTSFARAEWLASIRHGRGEWEQCLDSLAALWVAGVSVDWHAFDGDYARRRVPLPTYPFQRTPHWFVAAPTAATPAPSRSVAPRSVAPRSVAPRSDGPTRLRTAVPIFEIERTPDQAGFEPVHRVGGSQFVAAPFFIQAARDAVHALTGGDATTIVDLELIAPIRADGAYRVQLVARSEADGHAIAFHAEEPDSEEPAFRLAARARVPHTTAAEGRTRVDLAGVMARASHEWRRDELLARLTGCGVDCGASGLAVDRVWRRDGEALVRLDFAASMPPDWTPQVIDAVLLGPAAAAPISDTAARVLSRIGRVAFSHSPSAVVWVHATATAASAGAVRSDLRVTDASGVELMRVEGVELVPAPVLAAGQSATPEFYQVEWKDVSGSGPIGHSDGNVTDALERTFTRLAGEHGLARYGDLQGPLATLATAYARSALRILGALDGRGRATGESVAQARRRVVVAQRQLFDHLVRWFDSSDDGANAGDPIQIQRDLQQRFPQFEAELNLLARSGPHLASVLQGEAAPLDLLFGDSALLRRLYQQSPFARCFNTLAADVVGARGRGSQKRLRVLEIGAGTGGTTTWVLPRLDPTRTEYVFTDVSQGFLSLAADTFANYPFIEYRLFDVERSGTEQGLQPGTYDVVLAANVLHASADIRAAVRHARELVAPDGMLVLVEGTEPQRWVDLTFGLTDGWWRFAGRDPSRVYPLLSVDAWERLLTEEGFGEATIVPGSGSAAGQVLITATPDSAALAAAERRSWVVVADRSELTDAIVEGVVDAGHICERVAHSDTAGLARHDDLAGIVLVADVAEGATPVDAASTCCARLAELIRTVAVRPSTAKPLIWVVTCGAQAVGDHAGIRIDQAALWGVAPVAALEIPECWGGIIDVDPAQTDDANARAVVAEMIGRGDEDRVAVRAGRRLVPRLVARPPSATGALAPEAGSWLITGGLGAVGARTADWLARNGSRHLVLAGRSGLNPSAGDPSPTTRLEFVRSLQDRGVHVEVVEIDLTDGTAVAAMMRRFGDDWPALEGIVHAAAIFAMQPLAELTPEDFAGLVSAKALGAWHLHTHAPASLRHFLLFSSTASLIGGVGQAPYAAANAMLDALARARRFAGRPAFSINWGLWSAMRGVSEEARRQYAEIGFHEMDPDAALDAMSRIVGTGDAQGTLASIAWGRLRAAFQSRRPMPLLEQVTSAAPTSAPERPAADRRLFERLRALDARHRPDEALEWVSSRIASILRLPSASHVPPERGLFELGMDSLMSVELKRRLEEDLGQPLPSTLTFNHPSALALSKFLVGRVDADGGERHAVMPPPSPAALIDEMSEDELASALTRQLEDLS
jgi:acyl transferase domain-containing protein